MATFHSSFTVPEPSKRDPPILSYTRFSRWASHLDSAFAQQGLAAIKFDRHMIDRKFTPFWNESKLLTVADFIKTALAGDSEKAQQLRELLKRVAVEFRSGAGLTSDLVLALGRKPLEG